MTFFGGVVDSLQCGGSRRAHLSLRGSLSDSCGSFRSSGVPSSSNVEGSFASAGYFRLRSCCDCGIAAHAVLRRVFDPLFLRPRLMRFGCGNGSTCREVGLDLAEEGPKRAFLFISASSVLSMLICLWFRASLCISRARVGFAPDDDDGAGAHWALIEREGSELTRLRKARGDCAYRLSISGGSSRRSSCLRLWLAWGVCCS